LPGAFVALNLKNRLIAVTWITPTVRNHGHKGAATNTITDRGLLTLTDMADGSDAVATATAPNPSVTPADIVAGMKTFVTVHGGARAVIEYVGRRGARIVLVGEDGEWADYFADGTDVAREACATAGVHVDNEWERELIEQMRPSNDLWRSMSRRIFAR